MVSIQRVLLVAALVIGAFTAAGIFLPSPPDTAMRFFEEDYDRLVYFRRGSFEPRNEVPYLEVHSEYPELATWFMALPYLCMDDAPSDPIAYENTTPAGPKEYVPLFERYAILHSILMALCLFGSVALCAAIARHLGQDPRAAWLLILPSSLFFTVARYDALPVLLVSASLLLLLKKHYLPAIVVLSCAVLTKWYAILFLPFYLNYGKFALGRRILPGLFASAATAAIVVMTTFVTSGFRYAELSKSPEGARVIARLPAAKLPESFSKIIEVLPADMVPFVTGGTRAALSPYLHQGGRISNPGGLYEQMSMRWFHLPAGAPVERPILLALTLLQFCIMGFAFFVPQRDPMQLIRWMCLATAFFVLFAKFYSPQWVMWTNALVLLFMRHKLLVAVAVAIDLFLYLQFSVIRGTSLRGTLNPNGTWTLSDFWYHLYDVRIALSALFTLLVALSLFANRRRDGATSTPSLAPV